MNHDEVVMHRDTVLAAVEKKRGYTLAYHQLFAGLDSQLLERYDRFYEALTLREKYLAPREKELIWIAILAIASEEAGSIHLQRAAAAGVRTDEITASLSIAQLVRGFSIWSFVEKCWKDNLPGLDEMAAYDRIVDKTMDHRLLPPELTELIFIGAAAAAADARLLEHHYLRAAALGVAEEKIAEAMSFIFIPCGGNQLLDMATVIKNAVEAGKSAPTSIFQIWLCS